MNISKILDSAVRAVGNLNLATGALAVGSTAQNIAHGALSYLIDGIFRTKASNAVGVAFSSGHLKVKQNYSCLFVLTADAAGTLRTYQGRQFKTEVFEGATKYRGYNAELIPGSGDTKLTMAGDLVDFNCSFLPDGIPSTEAVIGIAKVAPTSADFTPGTTALTGIVTFTNVAALPDVTNL